MNSTHSPWCPELLAATYGLKDGALKHAKIEKNKNKNENTQEQAIFRMVWRTQHSGSAAPEVHRGLMTEGRE